MPRGGKRVGAGRPIVDVQLDLEAARELKILVQLHGVTYTREHCDMLVRVLIHKAWRAVDRELQEAAEHSYE